MFREEYGELLGWMSVSEGDVGDRRGTVREECDGLDLGVVIREAFGRCHPCSEGKGLADVTTKRRDSRAES